MREFMWSTRFQSLSRALLRASCLAVLAMLAACGADRGPASDLIPTLIPEEELRIGSVDDPLTSLTFLTAIEIAPDGRIYTIHPQENRVRIFTREGDPAGTLGGSGEGPGEFSFPSALGFRDGETWVIDGRTSRVSYFDADGAFLRDATIRPRAPEDAMLLPPSPQSMFPDGTFLGSSGVPSRLIESGEVTETPIVRMRPDGTLIDTVALRPVGGAQISLRQGSGGLYTSHPFADDPLVSVSTHTSEVVVVDRTARAENPLIEVTKLGLAGDTVWQRGVAYEPIPLEAAVVDSFVNQLAEMVVRRGFLTRGDAEDAIRADMELPAHLPPVDRSHQGRDGTVWLSMNDRDPKTTRWIVLGADGEVRGAVAFPGRLLILNATETVVWGMWRDELDIPYVVRYAVRPATPADQAR